MSITASPARPIAASAAVTNERSRGKSASSDVWLRNTLLAPIRERLSQWRPLGALFRYRRTNGSRAGRTQLRHRAGPQGPADASSSRAFIDMWRQSCIPERPNTRLWSAVAISRGFRRTTCRLGLYGRVNTRLHLNSKVALERLELPTRGLGRRRASAVRPRFAYPARIVGVIVFC